MSGKHNPNYEGSFHGPKDAYLISLKVNAENGRLGNTSIERAIQAKLGKLDVHYEPQKPMYYWHGNPKVYDECDLNAVQIKNKSRDKSKATYLIKCGHRMLMLWEKDIKKRIDWCVDQMIEAIRAAAIS
ncbi:hypothetical protein IAW_05019 [Bacillus cereus str. Schrouff]|nr:hypothetical protein IAW_05019 [Bacillus cereus str. Schrouff]EOO81852.1 hypothetical protein IGY_05563 [Bacillus cereus K-5975c]